MFLKRLTAIIISFFFLLASTPAISQELTSTSSGTPPVFTFLSKGEKAPFDGALFSPEATAKMLEDARTHDLQCQLKIEKEVNTALANCKLEKGLTEAALDAERKRNKLTVTQKDMEIEQLSALAADAQNNWLWASVGLFTGIVTMLGIVVAIK